MTEGYADLGGRTSRSALPTTIRGCGRHPCNHPDAHVCPWLDETHGNTAIPCGCTHRAENPKKARGK